MYATTQTQAKASPIIVMNLFLFLYALIDFGAMHYFIASGIVERIGLELTLILWSNIKMPNGDIIHNSHMLIKKTISLKG